MKKKKLLAAAAVYAALWAEVVRESVIDPTVRREILSDRSDRIRIVQVSDLHKRHFGKGGKRLITAVDREKPDLIFITGDIVSRSEKNFSTAASVIDGLCGIAPVYMIYGNHEQSIPEERAEEFRIMTEASDAVILRNSRRNVRIKGRMLHIAGIEPEYTVYKKNGGYRGLDRVDNEEMHRLVGKCPDGEVLLLAHDPLFGPAYAEWGADYTFSGHVHGGIIRILGCGILSPERRFFPRYTKGVYRMSGGRKLLVSAGLGKLRLFNPPEIVTYEL